MTEEFLDISGDVCPMTQVRVRMAMGKVAPGEMLKIRMASGEPVASIPRTLKEEGHEVLSMKKVDEDFELVVKKKT